MKFVTLVVALAMTLIAPAFAQAVPASANIKWTLPTTGCTPGVTPCDNKPLTGADALTAIEVYVSTSPIADTSTAAPTVTVAPGTTTATYNTTVTAGQTLYVRLKARNANSMSPFSNQVTKAITLPVVPGVPTNVTITIDIAP